MVSKLIRIDDYMKYKNDLGGNEVQLFLDEIKAEVAKETGENVENLNLELVFDQKYSIGTINRRYIIKPQTNSPKILKYFEDNGPVSLYVNFNS